ncbi:helix-turn-helix domain-containing protein [Krasilnikovia sp. M28-CT-15]|uniref:helix-turn-helix domain-containing protein n=1 Tax=Krasilnikovia sp. M28-CT-15 TaxID=3373540 RepID=UPI003876D946
MPGARGSIDRRRLGIELRQLREAKGLTLEDLKAHTGWSTSKGSRQERGLVPINPADLRTLMQFYEVKEQAIIDALFALASGSRGRDWWHRYDDVVSRQFSTYLGFEAVASVVQTYEGMVVPGLLQTPEYARALVDAVGDAQNEEEAGRRVEARTYRQQILQGDDAPRLHAILDEGIMHREVGGRDVMRGQLMHLLDAVRRTNVVVQVIPYQAGAHRAMEGGFIILRFAEDENSDVVSVDLRTRSLYIDDRAEVEEYREAWESVLATAASPLQSQQLIERAAEEMKR